ncbi:heat-inducible transcriptional repressor HrcA [Leptolyngbya sp. PCC 6406]|uniref:heat-inducible transcriptional repressor HrcA n=1 Tax=Leptolyngbya sp. PCC 6406 TaxID=1173264 RepID=UPI0002ABE124|nr:heat-inducible transcriptional repressor HrcA [Leptolyngbya sp. PCC 6406]
MSASLSLNSRQQRVLWATIRHYVATAEPVGSKVLAQEYDLQVSPATVRQAMGVLERAGFLYQPHTSAGRVPSDHGYRLYVDHLIQPSLQVAQQVDSSLSQGLDWGGWSIEALLRDAAQILSTLSGYLTLITVPQASPASIRHLQLVQVAPGQVLVVVVLTSLETQSMVMQLPPQEKAPTPEALERELQIVSNFLTTQLQGKTLADITLLDWGELGREFQRYAQALQASAGVIARRVQSTRASHFIMSGLAEVLRQPEFSETPRIQAIVQLLEEEQSQLWPLVFEAVSATESGRRVRVWIGSENPLEPMQGCALVSSTYTRGEVPVGSVSVLGPTRMVYEDAIAIVEAAAIYLSESLS